jgi:pyruvate ferredoxin oxidoreductase alpha subunit
MMVCANRAVSAPINIWNDQQDSIALRDSGWIQLYAENNQEALDLLIAGHKIGEDPKIMLPIMVCVDGFILTHGMETVDMPTQEEVDKFLPAYNPPFKLNIEDPMSFGLLGDPTVYAETRYAIQKTLEDVLTVIPTVGSQYQQLTKRDSVRLIEEYKTDDAETILVAMGSVCGSIKDVVDAQRQKGEKVGLLKIVTYRPFPKEKVSSVLEKAKYVGVIDKDISLGSDGALYTEIRACSSNQHISGFVAGLGGRDITIQTIENIINQTKEDPKSCTFVDIKQELLWDEFKV